MSDKTKLSNIFHEIKKSSINRNRIKQPNSYLLPNKSRLVKHVLLKPEEIKQLFYKTKSVKQNISHVSLFVNMPPTEAVSIWRRNQDTPISLPAMKITCHFLTIYG